MFNLNAFLLDEKNVVRAEPQHGFRMVRHIKCADGFEFSAQASSVAYCEPRDSAGPWTKVEVGFPSGLVPEFMPYAEDPDRPTQTVYGWVPVEIVEQVVNAHGGAAEDAG